MTILLDSHAPVKPAHSRRFGAGLVRSLPTYRLDHTFEDEAWLATESARRAAENRHYDRLAAEAEALDRLTNGCLL